MKYIDRLFKAPAGVSLDYEPPAPLGGLPSRAAMLANDTSMASPPPPAPVPATKMLRTNLERVTLAYNDRERVLVKEIADRETELADVRRARDAASAALDELEMANLPELTVTNEPATERLPHE